jgi:uracil-DNA glycosylase family 4
VPIQKPAISGASASEGPAASLAALNNRIIACNLCPRLRQHCCETAERKRRSYADHEYWGKPVPSFGDPNARVLILGLAPGAHGSNRTGRPFTGDGSGNFMFPILYEAGFASQPNSVSLNDGMMLHDAWMSGVVRCAPPDNKPLPEELRNCAPYLDEEVARLVNLRVIVCLGKIAFDGFAAHLLRAGGLDRPGGPGPRLNFAHGAEYSLASGQWLLATYHPSLQNTNTGRLTAAMMLAVFHRAAQLASKERPAQISAAKDIQPS